MCCALRFPSPCSQRHTVRKQAAEAAGDLRPRQGRPLPEPHQALWDVPGSDLVSLTWLVRCRGIGDTSLEARRGRPGSCCLWPGVVPHAGGQSLCRPRRGYCPDWPSCCCPFSGSPLPAWFSDRTRPG